MTSTFGVRTALDEALDAAAEIVLAGENPPTSALSIADVCRSAGVGVSAFYRAFGTVEDFNLGVVAATVREASFAGDRSFVANLETTVNPDDLAATNLYRLYIDRYVQSIPDDLFDPLTPLWAWLSHDEVAKSITHAALQLLERRAGIYELVIDAMGGSINEGMSGKAIAGIHMAIGKCLELYGTAVDGPDLERIRALEGDLLYATLAAAISPTEK